MSKNSIPRLAVVKREEKETKLREFVVEHLGAAWSGNVSVAHSTCLLVARSAESPVAKTILTMGSIASMRGFAVRAIFANLGTAETARIAEACRVSDWALQIRWARDIRLQDAHEQLVLGPSTSWTGDCMRREPSSRDACELYAADCAETARRSTLYFERLWQVSEPIFERAIATPAATDIVPAQSVEQLVASNAVKKPTTRTSA